MGVNYNTGNGGPASFSFSDVEMYGSDTSSAGTKRGLVCQAGGSLIVVDRSTITGGQRIGWIKQFSCLKII